MPRRRSPDGAPAAAQRRGGTTLTPTSGNPPSGGEEGPEPKTPNPAGAAQQTPYTPAPATVALSQEAVCCDHRQNPPNHLGTAELWMTVTLRRYDTDGRRSDEHRGCEETCAQRSTEAARLSSDEDNPAARRSRSARRIPVRR